MKPRRVVRIAILYLHPLLGEGLASLLSAEPGVIAVAAPRRDPAATRAALSDGPDLIVVEGADTVRGQPHTAHSPTVYFTTMDRSGRLLGPHLSDPDEVLNLARTLMEPPTLLSQAR
jgi:hypothetical protein